MINRNRVKVIIFKDLLEMKNDKATFIPLLIFPLIFSVFLPLVLLLGGINNPFTKGDMRAFVENMQAIIIPKGLPTGTEGVYAILLFFLLPLFMTIPVILSTVLASSSFVGEKEKKTLEGLLYTPVTNKELLLSKILAAALPSMIITWISIFIYGVLLDSFGYVIFERLVFPSWDWIVMGGLIAPLLTFLSITLVVVISQKAKTMKSAQSVSIIIILPIIAFVSSQASGLLLINVYLELLFALFLLITDVILLHVIAKKMNRENLVLHA